MTILGIQTEYSLLESNLKLNDLVNYIKKYNYSFLAFADKNSLTGLYKLSDIFKESKINTKIIAGIKINLKINNITYLVDLYPQNQLGYNEILKYLLQINYDNKLYELGELDLKNINLVFPIYNFKSFNLNLINSIINNIPNLYIGISNDNIEVSLFNEELYNYVTKNNINIVPYHKTLYLLEKDEPVNTLLNKIGNPNYRSDGGNYSLYTEEKINSLYQKFPFLKEGLNKFISTISFNLPKLKPEIIKYNQNRSLYELALSGLKHKLNTNTIPDNYLERLNYEYEIISQKGFTSYFLLVHDIISWAKSNDIYIGPGRGSAAASLVSYALNITNINPLKFNLYFERFLNKERMAMPDIDIDIPDDKRETLINFCIEKYGKEHLFGIATFDTFGIKSALRDALRVNNLNPDLSQLIINKQIDKHQDLLYLANELVGLPRHMGTHAAGIIFSNDNITNLVPLTKSSQVNLYQAQLESGDLEKLGFLKTDFLGLRNLKIINDTVKEIKKNNPKFNIKQISYEDEKTFNLLSSGNTNNIFQFESSGIRNVLRKYKPSNFSDIYKLLALYRPGPMDNIDEFIARKNGKEFSYIIPAIKEILSDTYGLILYQEQIMQIASKIAGYSLSDADTLRRGISKKKEDLLIKEKAHFIEGAIKNNIKQEDAIKIYDYILEFAQYGFNKAHAISYAVISYETAYLKANYLQEFSLALLNASLNDSTSALKIFTELKQNGYQVMLPDINISTDKYLAINKKIIYPLSLIKGLSKDAISLIITERNKKLFTDFNDFINRVKLPQKDIELLIKAHAFRKFNKNINALLKFHNENQFFLLSGLAPKQETTSEFSNEELMKLEREIFGFNYFYNELQYLAEIRAKHNYHSLANISSTNNYLGVITKIYERVSKKNTYYLKLDLKDDTSSVSCFLFKETFFNEVKDKLNIPLVFKIEVSNYNGDTTYIINNIYLPKK